MGLHALHFILHSAFWRRISTRWLGCIAIESRNFNIANMTTPPNQTLQRTRRERRGCNPRVLCAGSLSLGR
jgi:hypothetical protein